MMFRNSLIFLLISGILLMVGCQPDIIVHDKYGKPIPQVKITGHSLSISGQHTFTDNNGHANIPWCIQGTRWIGAEKQGYYPTNSIDIDQPKPIIIILEASFAP
ncbi:MAG: hypothetical protein JEZ07_00835 [Phycisphaerae bacterium]|nr:hypothetical protein [Phycisphaerae bacterium]